ncbi:MAG: hypothetical protein HY553_01800 [Elusimicrobia bacterium]|nr:hypothetical protein [Elusimicrobiota bacterium]
MNPAAAFAAALFVLSAVPACALDMRDAEVDFPAVEAVLRKAYAGLRGQPGVKAAEEAPVYVDRARLAVTPQELAALMLCAKAAVAEGRPFYRTGLIRTHVIAFPGVGEDGAFVPGRPGWIEFIAQDESGMLKFKLAADGRLAPWVQINGSMYALETGPAQQAISGELAIWLAKAQPPVEPALGDPPRPNGPSEPRS